MTFREALAYALLNFLWQGAAIGLGAGVALRALQSRSAAARYAVCLIALAGCVGTPILTMGLLYVGGPPWTSADSTNLLTRLVDTTVGWPNALNASWFSGVRLLVVPLWMLGAVVLSGRLLVAGRHVRMLRLSALEPPNAIVLTLERVVERVGVTTPVRLALSQLADGPSVIGWLRPLVLLPASVVSGLTPAQLETILAHELAHIRRYDYLANLAQSIVETLLFYHPVVWWLSTRTRHERELCCDDVVLRYYDARTGYARALVCLERLRQSAPSLALGAVDGPLGFRVRRVLGLAPVAPRSIAGPALTLTCVVAACVGSIVDPQRDQRGQEVTANVIVNGNETIAVAFTSTLEASRREAETKSMDLVGMRISAIQLSGLSADARAGLALPVHIGELVTADTEREIERSVHALSRTLRAEVVPLPGGQAAVMVAADTARVWGVNK